MSNADEIPADVLAMSKYCLDRLGRLYNQERRFVKDARDKLRDDGKMLDDDELRWLRDIHAKLKGHRNPLFN